jgi:Mrp family chromosome partitioning ATPase
MTNVSKNKHWMVYRNVNTKFTGREMLLQNIENALLHETHSEEPTRQKIYVITGMGGIGKSEICLKLANSMKKQLVVQIKAEKLLLT